ncbi:hypothetical protein [Lentzea aerocolonigenes]|nr:hypothetical protein [Lentzea aerocolonigenes]
MKRPLIGLALLLVATAAIGFLTPLPPQELCTYGKVSDLLR